MISIKIIENHWGFLFLSANKFRTRKNIDLFGTEGISGFD